jgi:hypothetical protein
MDVACSFVVRCPLDYVCLDVIECSSVGWLPRMTNLRYATQERTELPHFRNELLRSDSLKHF